MFLVCSSILVILLVVIYPKYPTCPNYPHIDVENKHTETCSDHYIDGGRSTPFYPLCMFTGEQVPSSCANSYAAALLAVCPNIFPLLISIIAILIVPIVDG